MKKVNIKKSLKYISITLIVIIITLFLAIKIRDTFAYFYFSNGETQETSVNIKTGLFDNLAFKVGKETLTISGTTASDTTTAKAILTANDENNKATDNYYFYINITHNNFVYTSSAKTAELVLTITKPDGNKLTSLEGFKYVTVGSVSGFDVTESTDLIKVVENKSISATSANNNTTTEEWKITLTAINPSQNSGKTIKANVIMLEDKITLATACKSKALATCIADNYQLDTNIYYHNSTLTNGANDGSYRYAGGDEILTQKALDAGYTKIVDSDLSVKTDLIISYGLSSTSNLYNVEQDAIKNGKFKLAYDNSNKTYDLYYTALIQAVNDGYVSRENINNYVCFGSNAYPCPLDNLYRIIGVFDEKNTSTNAIEKRVKLIKAYEELIVSDPYPRPVSGISPRNLTFSKSNDIGAPDKDAYRWNDQTTTIVNDWENSVLDNILNNLYLTNLTTTWSNKIATTEWKIGGGTYKELRDATPLTAYQNEIINPDANASGKTTTESKIGLMYVNDFGFAMKPEIWNQTLFNYDFTTNNDARNSNWLLYGKEEWTITRRSDNTTGSFFISSLGRVDMWYSYSTFVIRPTFYLNNNIALSGGSGTSTDPFRIS